MPSYLDENGTLYFWQKIKNIFSTKAQTVSNITRSGLTFTATRADATTFTFDQQDTTYSNATTNSAGLMSPSDKAKVDAITNDGTIAWYRKLESTYTATGSVTTIPIGIQDFGTADMLFVDINGLDLTPDEYTISGTNVVLANAISSGNVVHFVALRAVTATTEDIDDLKGEGVPAGGTAGQVLAKASGTDYDTEWVNQGSGGDSNQNAFSYVKVGNTTVAADTTTDTLELVGSNVTLTPDASNDAVTIGVTASDVTTALGNNPVARATADAAGANIADTYAKKTDIAGMYSYKGSVASASSLPGSPSVGDVYNIETASAYGAAGANVAWNGSSWDSLGEIFTITSITNAEIDVIVAS